MRLVQKALTFDDVLLVPAHSRVLPREVSLKTRLTRIAGIANIESSFALGQVKHAGALPLSR